MNETFMLGTKDGGKTYDIFAWDGDTTSVVCTTTDERLGQFITASLNHCQDFWQLPDDYALMDDAELYSSN